MEVTAGKFILSIEFQRVSSRNFRRGRRLNVAAEIAHSGQGTVDMAPTDPIFVGVHIHTCGGVKSCDHDLICWEYSVKPSTAHPEGIKYYVIAAQTYVTCRTLTAKSSLHLPVIIVEIALAMLLVTVVFLIATLCVCYKLHACRGTE